MARRSVFVCKDEYPFFEEIAVEFDWFPGFALSQKRKSQISIHQNFVNTYPNEKVLEISSASIYKLGNDLSAMNLSKRTKNGVTSVESAFQASKTFNVGGKKTGPFPEYMFLPGRECKKKVKESSNGAVTHEYIFDDMKFGAPDHFISLFYNYLYINALCEEENQAVAKALIDNGYTAFTDLATKAPNCQARSAAIYVSLVRNGLIDEAREYSSYLRLFRTTEEGKAVDRSAYKNVQVRLITGDVRLLSPVVRHTFKKEQAEMYYDELCGGLSNKKGAGNFLD